MVVSVTLGTKVMALHVKVRLLSNSDHAKRGKSEITTNSVQTGFQHLVHTPTKG